MTENRPDTIHNSIYNDILLSVYIRRGNGEVLVGSLRGDAAGRVKLVNVAEVEGRVDVGGLHPSIHLVDGSVEPETKE